ncbi:MAG: tetratricopeptide repeat protein [Dehalococcoidales bacterium]|nr:tetratricopeptide repeat protein [Dehalococcoidales bacterium]
MTYQEEEQSRLRRQSSREAITLAVQGKWREAIAVNKTLIETFPTDVEAYNRLGRAHMELGEYADAEAAYRKTLEIDSYNGIARKNLERLVLLKKTTKKTKTAVVVDSHKLEPQQFIEEIGKAGLVQLNNLAPPAVLAKMVAGDVVSLKVRGTALLAENRRGEYLGQVEARHGQRLVRLMRGGNRYSGAVVNSTDKSITVIIREVYQDPRQAGQLSFPTRGVEGVRPDITDRVIRRELEQEEALLGEPGYTVVGGEEHEVLEEAPIEDDFEEDSES